MEAWLAGADATGWGGGAGTVPCGGSTAAVTDGAAMPARFCRVATYAPMPAAVIHPSPIRAIAIRFETMTLELPGTGVILTQAAYRPAI
jgi:hypothetical protein